ncbi:MAG: dihydrofolate reductase family protein [Anaerolineae bacterium]|nr:dihydrofolate reductase family protein [Anaerolineae bacterium]
MRRIIVSTYVTLDGVIEAPQKWSLNYFDEEAAKFASEQLSAADALLLGRETYQGFAEAWPSRTGDFADRINSMTKYVISTTLEEPLGWDNSTLIKGDVIKEVDKLKQQPGQDILIYGTGRLANTLLQNGLIDEHRLWVVPVIWGSGRRIFEGMDTTLLELIDTKTLPSGTVILTHTLAGKA